MFDRTTWIAIALSIAGLIGWQWYYTNNFLPAKEAEKKDLVSQAPSSNKIPQEEHSVASTPVSESIPEFKARQETFDTSKAEYLFSDNSGGIQTITLFLHLGEKAHSLQLNNLSPMPIGALGEKSGDLVKTLNGFVMNADKAAGKVSFQRNESNGLIIKKNFVLPQTSGSPAEYTVGFDLTFENSGTTDLEVPSYFLSCGGASPVHATDASTYTRFDWFSKGKMTTIDVNWFSSGMIPIVGIETHPARPLYQMKNPDITWTAVTSQYFCTILTAEQKEQHSSVWSSRFEDPLIPKTANSKTIYGIEGGFILEPLHLAPGASITEHYTIFAGPKDFGALEKLGDQQQSVMNFGTFHLVSEFLLWAMNHLKQILGNYAAAIIVLTLLIKLILWPIQNKATSSMKQMQLLSPRMTELRSKYKDNPTKMNEELMKLYKQYGVNPFGGCLPMLVQIPIFFGFYSMLGTAIELRNSHFLWIHDLSQPDTIAHFLNYPINLLPIIMAGTMLWQMSLSPKGGDPAQQRVMYFMPLIFLFFCYNFASALALYWTTQNLFSIGQLYLTRNAPLPQLIEPAPKRKRGFPKGKSKKTKS
ncbi:MAG: membrane protein insertase YidC [Chthoniobacterales bacterium]|nr:membrane protein insertase YidC [Chthoniobacterales bacterium]